jgi:hypothetical protein
MKAQLSQSRGQSSCVATGWPRGNGQIFACLLYYDSGTSATRGRRRNGYSANSTVLHTETSFLTVRGQQNSIQTGESDDGGASASCGKTTPGDGGCSHRWCRSPNGSQPVFHKVQMTTPVARRFHLRG